MPSGPAKTVLPWLAVAAAFIAAVGVIFTANDSLQSEHHKNFSALPTPAIQELRPQTVRLQIEFANGRKRAFRGQAQAGMTVLSALRASAEAGGFSVRTDERGLIVEIGNDRNSAAQRWAFFLNAERRADLAGHVELKAGDKMVFRYE